MQEFPESLDTWAPGRGGELNRRSSEVVCAQGKVEQRPAVDCLYLRGRTQTSDSPGALRAVREAVKPCRPP